jgi:hypothetical protein
MVRLPQSRIAIWATGGHWEGTQNLFNDRVAPLWLFAEQNMHAVISSPLPLWPGGEYTWVPACGSHKAFEINGSAVEK